MIVTIYYNLTTTYVRLYLIQFIMRSSIEQLKLYNIYKTNFKIQYLQQKASTTYKLETIQHESQTMCTNNKRIQDIKCTDGKQLECHGT